MAGSRYSPEVNSITIVVDSEKQKRHAPSIARSGVLSGVGDGGGGGDSFITTNAARVVQEATMPGIGEVAPRRCMLRRKQLHTHSHAHADTIFHFFDR